ncbi:hypothetical protein EEAAV_26765 (plasmid) [Rahnella aceris]
MIKISISALVLASLLSGCATNVGKTPETAFNAYTHGSYWVSNPQYSVAKNSYSLAGVDTSFKDTEVSPGSSDEAGVTKYLMNGTMGAVTGGLSGLGIMSMASLYSRDDAEMLVAPQFVVFVPNPNYLEYDNDLLVKQGAKYVFNFLKDDAVKLGLNASKQAKAVDECVISHSSMNKWDECNLPNEPAADVAVAAKLFLYQAIRPATGAELTQLGLPKGNYSVIRYVGMRTTFEQTSKGFSGFFMRPNSPKTTPSQMSVSIQGKDYYLFSGKLGQSGFPEKTLKK